MNNSLSVPLPLRPSSSHSAASSLIGSDSDDDGAPLPFPTALPRTDFLAPAFEPAAYLSSLPHRHQTLEDLRSELRDRSAAISAELLELVNSNYTAFLSLGSELRGGDEKVEDVKVALLGFRRAVEDVRGKVGAREGQVESLSAELGGVRAGIERGRMMMDLAERVAALEERLAIDSLSSDVKNQPGGFWAADESDEEEEEDAGLAFVGSSPGKLLSLAKALLQVEGLADEVGRNHPFVVKMEERLARCRNTLILDLTSGLKEAKKAGVKAGLRTVRYLNVYSILDAKAEAIKALKDA